jgi:predicted  nucleic acid-binding Zn-ribbon protein
VSKAKDLDRRIQALEARGDLLPESAKKQLADLKAQRKGTGISSAQIQAADLQGEIRNLEEAIVRLKKTDTGFDKRRSEQIKRLEAQRDQMRARLGGAATSGISREQMR